MSALVALCRARTAASSSLLNSLVRPAFRSLSTGNTHTPDLPEYMFASFELHYLLWRNDYAMKLLVLCFILGWPLYDKSFKLSGFSISFGEMWSNRLNCEVFIHKHCSYKKKPLDTVSFCGFCHGIKPLLLFYEIINGLACICSPFFCNYVSTM